MSGLKGYEGLVPQVSKLVDERIQKLLAGQKGGALQGLAGIVTYSDRKLNETVNELSKLFVTQSEMVELSAKVDDLAINLQYMVKNGIVSGLTVSETSPPSMSITITSGYGSAKGRPCRLDSNKTIEIPKDRYVSLWYVTLQSYGSVNLSLSEKDDELTLAKIIIPEPTFVERIIDDKPSDGYDGWIVQASDMYFGGNQTFDEDSIEVIREAMSTILADTIIGTLRLSENLRIENTQGSLALDSRSVKIKSRKGTVLARFDEDGTYYFNDNGVERAHFGINDAKIGNIIITKDSLESLDYTAGSTGFQIRSNGNVEFNDITARGTIIANAGTIGGWTIADNMIYSNSSGAGILQGGLIRTSANVGAGANGVMMDSAGLRGYSDVLGQVFNLPTDGSAPTFSSGIINQTIFEINTNSILRTAETVGDGGSMSAGILINNTGLYGCEANQTLSNANLKALIDGTVRLSGEIQATSGDIGGITIRENSLDGGLIKGARIQAPLIMTSEELPRIRIDTEGILYEVTTNVGVYGTFNYGDGTLYGSGINAIAFNVNYPPFSVLTEQGDTADLRLYDRSARPTAGTSSHITGDIICVNGIINVCDADGSPGVFHEIMHTKYDQFITGAKTFYDSIDITERLQIPQDEPTTLVDGCIWIV